MFTDPQSITPRVRVMQIIVGALTQGCIFALAIMYFLRDAQAKTAAVPLLTYIGLGFCGSLALVRLIVPGVVVGAGRQKLAGVAESARTEGLLQLYQVRTIIAAALLEAGAFYMAIAYMTEGQPLALGVGAAMAVAVAAHFPTAAAVAAWIDDQQELLRFQPPSDFPR